MLQDHVLPINFGQGVDSKTDSKLVVPGKFLMVQNGIFTNPGSIRKRNGYGPLTNAIAGGGTLVSPQMLKSYGSQLLTADHGNLYCYSSALQAWSKVGLYQSTAISRAGIYSAVPVSGYQDSVNVGNYAVYAWTSFSKASTGSYQSVYVAVIDTITGAFVISPTPILTYNANNWMGVRCVLIAGTTAGIVMPTQNGSGLQLVTVSFSGTTASLGSAVTITTGLQKSSNTAGVILNPFEAIGTATGMTLGYFNSTGITIANVNTSGSVTASTTITDAAANGPLVLCQNPNDNNIFVYYSRFTVNGSGQMTAGSLVWAVVTSSLASVLAPTTALTYSAPYYISNLVAVPTGSTSQTIYYGGVTQLSVNSGGINGCAWLDSTSKLTVNEAGTAGSATLVANGVLPYSRAATVTANSYTSTYMVLAYRTLDTPTSLQVQTTLFVMDLNSSCVVARLAAGTAACQALGFAGSAMNALYTYTPFAALWAAPNLNVIGTQLRFTTAVQLQALPANALFSTFWYGGLAGLYSYAVDFGSGSAYSGAQTGTELVLSGGNPTLYDGQIASEWGFHMAPQIVNAVPGTSGGMPSGTYSFFAVLQWTDANGDLHQSAPSAPMSVSVTGPNGSVTLTVTAAYLSGKSNPSVAIYRTTSAGSIYYLNTDPVVVTNAGPSALTIQFTNGATDGQIQNDYQAYSYPGSAVLSNSPPAPFLAAASFNNRLYFVSSEDGALWSSKSYKSEVGLSPSAFLTQQIDAQYGQIQALAPMDDKLVMFKPQGICIQSGDGPGDTGTGSTLTSPAFIPSPVGIKDPKSVILTQKGIMFNSQSGFHLLDRSLQLHYADQFFDGSAVEAFSSQTFTDARIIPGTSQIRFLAASGYSLVYDYLFDRWGSFTNHLGLCSALYQGMYTYLRTSGAIYQETLGSYLDGASPYTLRAQTSWLALGGVQGFERVRRIAMLGDFLSGGTTHGLQVSAAYDWTPAFTSPVAYAFPATPGVFQYRERLIRQKCDALCLLIEEVVTGTSSEWMGLTNLSLEAGVKRGINKLPPGQSLG